MCKLLMITIRRVKMMCAWNWTFWNEEVGESGAYGKLGIVYGETFELREHLGSLLWWDYPIEDIGKGCPQVRKHGLNIAQDTRHCEGCFRPLMRILTIRSTSSEKE